MLGHPLQPHRIMRKMAMCTDVKEMLDDPDIRQAAICSECGVCEVYACPMGLQPRVMNAMLKGELARAGIRYQREQTAWTVNPNRACRKIPTQRAAARAGVLDYYKIYHHMYVEETAD